MAAFISDMRRMVSCKRRDDPPVVLDVIEREGATAPDPSATCRRLGSPPTWKAHTSGGDFRRNTARAGRAAACRG